MHFLCRPWRGHRARPARLQERGQERGGQGALPAVGAQTRGTFMELPGGAEGAAATDQANRVGVTGAAETPLRRERTPLPVTLHDVTQVLHDRLCKAPLSLAIRGECAYGGELCPPRTTVLCLQETVATKLTSRSWCREGCVRSGFSESVDMTQDLKCGEERTGPYFGALPNSKSPTCRTPPSATHHCGRSVTLRLS